MTAQLSKLTQRTLEVAEAGGDLITFIGAIEIPAQPVAIDGHGGTDWIVLDARIDAHFQAGTLGMPRRCSRHLRAIQKSGAAFDGILVGHELPPGTISSIHESHPSTKQTNFAAIAKVIGPPPISKSTAVAARVASVTTNVVAKAALGVGIAAAAVAAAPLAALAALDLDPVLFGMVTDDPAAKPGSLAALFYLTSWTN